MIADPDSEVVVFAQRTVKDLKLPPHFVTQISQSIQVPFSSSFLITLLAVNSFNLSIHIGWLFLYPMTAEVCMLEKRLSLTKSISFLCWLDLTRLLSPL
jgi:SWI/SNF-related matrix-associated actin-dependent regulator of chromatin subfamily B protein 1